MKKLSVFALIFVLFSFFSCTMALEASSSVGHKNYTVSQSRDADKKVIIQLTFGSMEKTIAIPDFSGTSLQDYSIEKLIVYVDGTALDPISVGSDFSSITLYVTGGNHSIYLEALNSSDKVILKSSEWNDEITSGISINLALSAFQETSQKGVIQITLTYPKRSAGSETYYVKCDVDGKNPKNEPAAGYYTVVLKTDETTEQTYIISDLSPGMHNINFTICKDTSFEDNATVSFGAQVYSNMVTNKLFNASNGQFEDTAVISYDYMQAPLSNKYAVCVNGTGGVFVDRGTITVDGKTRECIVYDNVSDAIDFATTAKGFSNDLNPEIFISGTVTETPTDGSMINISISGKTLNLTGYKPSLSDVAVLDAASNSRVLKVTSGSVNIKSLTLKNGSADNGAGIYLEGNVNVTLDSGAYIQSNTASKCGGGIYMNNETGQESYLTILDGAQISGNNTNATTGEDTGGAGIFCSKKCSIVMKGGTVSLNKSQTYGGGIFNNGKVYMSGNAVIGNSSVGSNNYAYLSTGCSNYAEKSGGGIYNNGDTSNPAAVYLGKTWDFDEAQIKDETLSKGIYYNFANNSANSGGAVWCGQYAELTIVSGNIANNGGRQGAGICNVGGNLKVVSKSDSTISFTKNYAQASSGAIKSTVDFEMGGNVFFNSWSGTSIKEDNVFIDSIKIKLVSPLNENTTIGITALPAHVFNGSVVIEKTSSYSGDFASDAKKCSYIPNGTVPKYLKIAEDGCFRMEPSSSLSGNDFTYVTPLDDWSYTWNEEPGITTVDDFSDKPVLRMFLKIPDTESYVALKISFTGQGGDFIYDAWTVLTDGSKVHKAPDGTIEFDSENWFIDIDFDGDDSDDISIKFQGGEVNLEAEKDYTKYYIFD